MKVPNRPSIEVNLPDGLHRSWCTAKLGYIKWYSVDVGAQPSITVRVNHTDTTIFDPKNFKLIPIQRKVKLKSTDEVLILMGISCKDGTITALNESPKQTITLPICDVDVFAFASTEQRKELSEFYNSLFTEPVTIL